MNTLSTYHEQDTLDQTMSRILKPMSKRDFLDDVEIAEEEIRQRNYSSAKEVFDELEHRYGIWCYIYGYCQGANQKYFMIYKIVKTQVFIAGVYHDLQDYENIFH